MEYFDVFIVGVGLFGIGVVCYLCLECLMKIFVIFEACEVSGGTWDLFWYLGICFDLDMFTLGYWFWLWWELKVFVDGLSILCYVCDMVCDYGVD